MRARRSLVALTFCVVAVLAWRRAEGAPAPTWRLLDPPADGSIVGADTTGFWTQRGAHYRPDGKRDLQLKLPDVLRDTIHVATSGPAGPVVVGTFEEENGTDGARVSAFDRSGREIWNVMLGGDYDKSGNVANAIMGVHGLFVDPNGDVVLAGDFTGCVRFAGKGKGKGTCINVKAAERFDNGICDPCRQFFVAVYDAHGKLRTVFAPPGYPAAFFAAAADGRIALAGGWESSLDLDPDPARAAVVKQLGNPRPGAGDLQAFWSIFDRGNGMRWLGGQAVLVRHGSTYPKGGVAFDTDGTLMTLVIARPGSKTKTCTLTDGTTSTTAPVESPHTILIAAERRGEGPAAARRTTETRRMTDNDPEPRLFASPTGGIFAYGALEAPAGAVLVEAPSPNQHETAIVGLYGPGKGIGVRLSGEIFVPTAALAHEGRVCFAFGVRGAHKLENGAAGAISFGRPQAGTNVIGCFQP
ncbi:MAG TPA: hypothetical protein VN903_17440 [Polyangia bacterium]|nr:hypothetical protein [Polyangia bacterium]